MVNVIYYTVTVGNIDQCFQNIDNILIGKRTSTFGFFSAKTTIKFHSTNSGKIITIITEEQVSKQVLSRIFGWWLTRTHHAVNFDLSFQLAGSWINTKSVRNERTMIKIIGEQRLNFFNTRRQQCFNQLFAYFIIGISNNFTGFLVDNVMSNNFTYEQLARYNQFINALFFKLLDVTCSYTTTGFNNNFFAGLDIKNCRVAT